MKMMRAALVLVLLSLAAMANAQNFSIRAVSFSDSVYLKQSALQEIAAGYTRRAIGFDDLQEMLGKVNALYAAAGVVTARAILPAQEIANGVLKVELIEATVEAVVTEGLTRTDPDFIRRSIRIPVGQHPDFAVIEQELRLFEVAHDFRPTLTFAPGGVPGTAAARIGGDEPERYGFSASLDNFGSVSTGRARLSLSGQINSVSGVRDTLFGQVQVSEGAASGSIGYSRPVNDRGGRITAAANFSNSAVIAGPFAGVDIVSDSTAFSFGYSQPVAVRPDSHWVLSADLIAEQASSDISGVPFSDTNLREIRLTGAWQKFSPTYSLTGAVGLKFGIAEDRQGTKGETSYRILFGNLSYARRLDQLGIFTAQFDMQLASGQDLPVARLYSTGGATSMRGYPNGVRSGINALIAKLQLTSAKQHTVPGLAGVKVTPFGFFDLGLVVPYRPQGGIDSDLDYLASVGFGLRATLSQKMSGIIMVASPLRNTTGFTEKGSVTGYIGLDYKF